MRYRFQCKECGIYFEKEFLSISQYKEQLNKKQIDCPNCKSLNIERVFIEQPSVIYKQEGFTKKVKQEKNDKE